MLVGLNSSHCFTSLRDSSSQQLLPLSSSQQEGQRHHLTRGNRMGGSDATGGLPDLTSPQGPRWASALQHGLCHRFAQSKPDGSPARWSEGTSENVIAKSCVKFKKKKTKTKNKNQLLEVIFKARLLAGVNPCSSLESAAVTADYAFLKIWPSNRLFADSSFISVRNAGEGGVVLRVKDFYCSCLQN